MKLAAFKLPFVTLAGLLLIVSCGPVKLVPSATPIATSTAMATVLSTVTANPTTTPIPTLTQTPVFPLPTEHIPTWETPTPIATSDEKSADFHLKKMDENQLAQLISQMNQYSIENFPSMGDWGSEGQFVDSQQAVKMAIQEYLYRFPDSADANQYRWQLAFISAIDWQSEKDSVDSLIISSIQRELDSGDVTPETLETFLDRYWFDLGFLQRIDNLFGDGKIAWFYEVIPQYWLDAEQNASPDDKDASWGGKGLFFVVRENPTGRFNVIILNSAWNKNENSIYEVSDRNQNGIPEISLYVGAHSGTMCDGKLLVYEWNGQEFVELTRGSIKITDCSVGFSYFTDKGQSAIRVQGYYYAPDAIFIWNGEYYQFDHYLDDDLFNVWQSYYGDNKSEAAILTKILGSEESTKMNAGFANYLRFRLSVVYALDGRQDEATKEFMQLASSPISSSNDIFPKLATRFLKFYEQSNLYRACVETNKMYQDVLTANKDSTGSLRDGFFKELFGISVDHVSDPTCDGDDAFPLLISSLSSSIKNLPAELKQRGASLAYVCKLDVNLDGQDEWLVVTNPNLSSFIVWADSGKYQARGVGLFDSYYVVDWAALKISVEKWEALPNPVMILTLSGEQIIVEIDKTFETKYILDEFYYGGKFNSTEITTTNSMPLVQYTYSLPTSEIWYPQLPWSRFHWNARTQTFDEVSIENLLFTEKNPETVVNLLDDVLQLMIAWEKSPYTDKSELPHFYYSAALAYELAGDENKAVELYYYVWSKFPDSHYALMAHYRLEPNQ
jgi:hypothetical protein